MEGGDLREVHFVVGAGPRARRETAAFCADVPSDELKDLFRAAAEAGPLDILKLYGPGGRLLNISPRLAPNSADRPYRLEVVAAHCQGMLLDEVGVDLRALEERVSRLEAQLRGDAGELPPAVRLLQQQVERFRSKLETAEHLSWMGFYKDMPPPLSTESCRRLQYRRKSDSMKKKVREKFFSICDAAVSDEVRQRLRQPSFDSCQWEDEELLLLLQQMFIDLDLPSKFGIEMPVLRAFLYEVYKNYNDVPFHNFRHSFCVAQMMYSIVRAVELPAKVGDLEILILLTSCICHDLDHPGYNNIYQINAKTELALRYNDISPLENHHCSVAFRVLENADCNIFRTLPADVFRQVREGMIRCILATDMARHNEILAQFKELTPEFDFDNKAHVNLLSMVLIKVADISNEARPMEVAEPWLDRLLQEFFQQSDAEKLEGLPVTPFMDRDKVTKPSSQCSFIGLVLLPLFEALGELFQVLVPLIVQPVRDALDYYRRLNERPHHRKSVIDVGSAGGDSIGSLAKSGSAHSVKSRRSIASRSRSADVEDGVCGGGPGGGGGTGIIPPGGMSGGGIGTGGVAAIGDSSATATVHEEAEDMEADTVDTEVPAADVEVEEDDDEEDGEEEEDETATEVEVSEKTLKFKIATETSIGGGGGGGRPSGPGSRKGSRERTQSEFNQSDLARAMQQVHKQQRGSLAATPPDTCNGGSSEGAPSAEATMATAPMAAVCGANIGSGGRGAGRPASLLQRLRTFTERLPFGTADDASHNCRPTTTLDAAETEGRPTTLPKARKGASTATTVAHRRGWRTFIGGGGSAGAKGEAPSSSLELLSPSDASPTPASKRQLFATKRNSFTAGSLDSMLHPGASGGGGGAGGGSPRKSPGGGLFSQLGFSFRTRRPRTSATAAGGSPPGAGGGASATK